MTAHILEPQELIALFQKMAGRKFIGAVDGIGAVELVFDDGDTWLVNLVTINTEGERIGIVDLGFVAHPEQYVEASQGKDVQWPVME